MSYQAKRGWCWGIATGMVAALFAFALLVTDVQFATNDDAGIMRAFLGYESETPANVHLYIHGLLTWPLYWLSCAFPGMPWFTYLQLVLMAVACLVIAKSIMQCFVKQQKPLWLGAVLAACVLLTLCLINITFITFTMTAALLGMAAVLQMFSIDHDRGTWRVVLGMGGAVTLLALGYALREEALLPFLAFCGLAFVTLLLWHYGPKKERSYKPMVISFVMVAVVVLGLLGARQLEYQREDLKDYLPWQYARSDLTDFYNLDTVTEEALQEMGWDEYTLLMLKESCYLEKDLNTESLIAMKEYLDTHDTRTFADRMAHTQKVLHDLTSKNPFEMLSLVLVLIVFACTLLGVLLHPRSRGLFLFSIFTALAGAAIMLFYLAYNNRLPVHAALVVLLPASALLLALLPAALTRRTTSLLVACCVLCVAHTTVFLMQTMPTLLPNQQEELELGSAMSDLEEYALWEPESLFIYDNTLVGADARAFPDYSEGIPHNITYWGGWDLRSPQSIEQFDRFGIDLMNFDPEELLREDIFIASGRVDPPPQRLLRWVQARLGPDVECELWSEYGVVYIFHFYRY